jgi:hypothetical protein
MKADLEDPNGPVRNAAVRGATQSVWQSAAQQVKQIYTKAAEDHVQFLTSNNQPLTPPSWAQTDASAITALLQMTLTPHPSTPDRVTVPSVGEGDADTNTFLLQTSEQDRTKTRTVPTPTTSSFSSSLSTSSSTSSLNPTPTALISEKDQASMGDYAEDSPLRVFMEMEANLLQVALNLHEHGLSMPELEGEKAIPFHDVVRDRQ